jgi:hypothetical protein
MIDFAYGNYASVLWNAGRLVEARSVIAEAQEVVHVPTIQVLLAWVAACLAEASGEPIAPLPPDAGSGASWDMAALGCHEILRYLSTGDAERAAELTRPTLEHVVASAGLADDFMNFWPILVRAAVAAGKADLAVELLEPATTAAPGILSPAVAAHLHHLKGVVGALRGDASEQVEADLRAGVTALNDLGAVGLSAKAEEDLGRWLCAQGRTDAGETALARAADVYREIGATGWLSTLNEWRRPSVAASSRANT